MSHAIEREGRDSRVELHVFVCLELILILALQDSDELVDAHLRNKERVNTTERFKGHPTRDHWVKRRRSGNDRTENQLAIIVPHPVSNETTFFVMIST